MSAEREVYLDHAASASLRMESRDAWLRAQELVGNASSVHGSGQRVRRVLEESRETIAAVLGCEAIEVVFTSGGTESINLALQGLWAARTGSENAVVLPDAEHHATMDTVAWLKAHASADVVHVPVDALGRIDNDAWSNALPHAVLATALAANNEVGTINDVPFLANAASEAGVPLHIDAVGAVGSLPLSFAEWRGDAAAGRGLVAMSIAGHKIGAPAGTGALIVSRTAQVHPLMHGGGQQRGLRAGSQDVAGAAALAAAVVAADAERGEIVPRVSRLRDDLVAGILKAIPEAVLLGDPEDRLPGNAHLLFPGAPGESLLYLLDREGISVSTGSACQAGVPEPSHVVMAMGRSEKDAREVLRFSLGGETIDEDISRVLSALPEVYRRASGARTASRT